MDRSPVADSFSEPGVGGAQSGGGQAASGAFSAGVKLPIESGGTFSGGASGQGGFGSPGGAAQGGKGGATQTAGGSPGMSPNCGEPLASTAQDAGFEVGAAVYTFADEGGSCAAGTAQGGAACVRGQSAQVVYDDWASIWGGGLGVALAESLGPVDVSAYEGFSFSFKGTVPYQLRVGLALEGETNDFFTLAVHEGDNVISFSDLAQGTWVAAPQPLDLTRVANLHFHVPTTDRYPVAYDFCVSGLAWVKGPDGQGGEGPAGP